MTDFELGELSQYEKLGKLPAAVYTPDRKHPYQSMLQALDVIKETDLANRRTLAQNMDDLAVLQVWKNNTASCISYLSWQNTMEHTSPLMKTLTW
ncbi:Uncharacterised protein [Moraxella caprae]|uniref:Uncharacterized protein n=1 Tax=Moraxella caprae TaxID=90240 RepID=A0A378U7I8_9GAMM|nr:hypothetical protein [Moraxella caprae]STZ70292.1 Uncharacterised protein [Moraxella caprae]